MKTKVCTKCNTAFPETAEFFNRHKLGKNGLHSRCKSCCAKAAFACYEKSRDLKRSQNKCGVCGKILANRITSTKYCAECKKEKRKEWRRNDYQKHKDRWSEYEFRNKDSIREKQRHLASLHRDRLSDRYVIKLLSEKPGIPINVIRANPELIKAKRFHIKIQRLCKTSET